MHSGKDLHISWDNMVFLCAISLLPEKRALLFSILQKQSYRRCSVKKVFLEISQNSQENTCARVSFLIKLQAWDSGTGIFLWILQNFLEHLFYRTPPVAASEPMKCLILGGYTNTSIAVFKYQNISKNRSQNTPNKFEFFNFDKFFEITMF